MLRVPSGNRDFEKTMMQISSQDFLLRNDKLPERAKDSKPLILIVEDEEAIVTLLDYNLRSAGYDTIVARDGEEAVDLALTMAPNAILLDWMLPLRSGLEVSTSAALPGNQRRTNHHADRTGRRTG